MVEFDDFAHLVFPDLVLGSSDNFGPVGINMSLEKRHRLGQNVEASTHEIDEEALMISDDAEYSLVVVPGGLRVELNDDSHLTLGRNGSLNLRKAEYISSIVEELEIRWLVRIINNIQKSVSALRKLDFTKVNGFGR